MFVAPKMLHPLDVFVQTIFAGQFVGSKIEKDNIKNTTLYSRFVQIIKSVMLTSHPPGKMINSLIRG